MDKIHIIAYVMKKSRMCDDRAMWNNYSSWDTNFYHQYLQQHARMTQWIQNLHQNLPQPWQSFSNSENHMCCHNHHQNEQLPVNQAHYIPHQGHHVPQQMHHVPQQIHHLSQQGHHVPHQVHRLPQQGHHVQHRQNLVRCREHSRRNSHYDAHHRSRSQTSVEYTTDNENDVPEEVEEDGDSEGELVLNVDAILAFRATKEAPDEEAKSEESFELVDAILDQNFEFVELDDAGQLQKMYGRPSVSDTKGDVEYDREARIVLYGDRSDRIAGLETSLEIMFDHVKDLHQPVVFPH